MKKVFSPYPWIFCLFFSQLVVFGNSWENPPEIVANVDTGSEVVSAPQIVTDDSGNAYAVWLFQDIDSLFHIMYGERPANGSWGNQIDLSGSLMAGSTPLLQLVLSRSQTRYISWTSGNFADLFGVSVRGAVGEGAPDNVQALLTGANFISSLSLAASPTTMYDAAVVAIENTIASELKIMYASLTPNASTSIQAITASLNNIDSPPSVAMDTEGNALLIWIDQTHASHYVLYTVWPYLMSGFQSATTLIATGMENAVCAITNCGNQGPNTNDLIVATWASGDPVVGGVSVAYATISSGVAHWSSVTILPETVIDFNYIGLNIVAEVSPINPSTSTAAISWSHMSGGQPITGIASNADITNTSGWFVTVPFFTASTLPSLGMDATGNTTAIWMDTPDSNQLIQGSIFPFGGSSWTPIEIVSNETAGSFNAAAPKVSGYGDGGAIAIWDITIVSDYQIQSAVHHFAPTVNPPTNLKGSHRINRFLTCGEYFNTLSWTASTSSVVNYQIYRNGVLIVTLPSSVLTYQDHIQPNQPVTYQVVAVDGAGKTSSAATISL